MKRIFFFCTLAGAHCVSAVPQGKVLSILPTSPTAPKTQVLFLGHQSNNHHGPTRLRDRLAPAFSTANIEITFTDSATFTWEDIKGYDGILMYGNLRSSFANIAWPEVPILSRFVNEGGGLCPLHVAAAAYRVNDEFQALIGGRFDHHGAQQFDVRHKEPNHIILKNLEPLSSFDESYVLININPDIELIQDYDISEGVTLPITWTRNQEKGRVFYNGNGHLAFYGSQDGDYNATLKPEWQELVTRGINWSTKHHFSEVTSLAAGPDGVVVGSAKQAADDAVTCWSSSNRGPRIFTTEGDDILVENVSYTFNTTSSERIFPINGGKAVIGRQVTTADGDIKHGIWLKEGNDTITPIALEGQNLLTTPGKNIDAINPEFVATPDGSILFRAKLSDETTQAITSAIVKIPGGIVYEEGQSSSPLSGNESFADLYNGPLAMNASGTWIAPVAVNSPDTSELLILTSITSTSAITRQNELIDPAGTSRWGSVRQVTINSAGDIGAFLEINTNDPAINNCIISQRVDTGIRTIVATEGQLIESSTTIGEINNPYLAISETGNVHFFVSLAGSAVDPTNNQALFRNNSLLLREGDVIPLIGGTSIMGGTLGTSPLAIAPDDTISFVANSNKNSEDINVLFTIQGHTVYPMIAEGESFTDGPGPGYTIQSIAPLADGSYASGHPSNFGPDNNLVIEIRTTEDQALVIGYSNLSDFDGDGLSNQLEAAIGSDINSATTTPELLPKLEQRNEQFHFNFIAANSSVLPSVVVQTSNLLADWLDNTEPAVLHSDQSNVPEGYQRMTLPLPSNSDQLFVRLKAN